jgi:3-(3-hydroxy-phenyl)propionate hydroxylase
VDNHRRWQFALNPDEDPKSFEASEVAWRLLSRWIAPSDGRLQRHTTYHFRGLVANAWRRGRVFIAGDAAHQQPPYLGQGLCQGIRDVANLSWKLSAVLQGKCGSAALDTYGVERRAHVRQFTTHLKALGRSTFDRDPDRARARDARLLAECGGVVPTARRQGLQPRLIEGFMSPIDHPANGTIFPQPWVSVDGRRARFDDAVGCGWRLVLSEEAVDIEIPEELGTVLPLKKISLGDRSSGIREVEGVLGNWFRQYACSAALVRPDHYVFGTGASSRDLQVLFSALQAWIANKPSRSAQSRRRLRR